MFIRAEAGPFGGECDLTISASNPNPTWSCTGSLRVPLKSPRIDVGGKVIPKMTWIQDGSSAADLDPAKAQ